MGKFHDDGTLEIGGFGAETIEESATVREIDVLKMKYKCLKEGYQTLKEGFEILTNYVRDIERNESQLRANLRFISRCFIVTNAALLVSIIGLLVHAIMSN